MSVSPDDTAHDWALRPAAAAPEWAPAHRPIAVGDVAGYVDPIGVRPGEPLRIHLSAPAAHEISILRLGRGALLDPSADDAADRAQAATLATLDRPSASRHDLYPGSYAWVDAPSLGRPAAISAWVRPWRVIPTAEAWNWSAIASDFDFYEHCHWALVLDGEGRPGCYFGDRGLHRREWWTFATGSLADRLGEWIHLAASVEEGVTRLYVDGLMVAEGKAAADGAPAARGSAPRRVRIAAAAENGVADHLLDGDISAVTLLGRPLLPREVSVLTEDRGLSAPADVGLDAVDACWPLRETVGAVLADASGNGHDAELVNHGSLGIPGPSASEGIGRPGYDPAADPTRGGAVRFACDDLIDCGWPVAAEAVVPADADSGTYCVRIALAGSADALEIPFVVVRPTPRGEQAIALVYATFTWTAYARRPIGDLVVPGLASSYYTRGLAGQPFFHLGLRVPLTRAKPFEHVTHLRATTLHQHIVRPERLAEAWLDREDYAYECITDAELDAEPELLDRFAAVMIVGHNEYWTQRMRDGVEAYLDRGGDVVCLSGNTAFWRVTYDPETQSLEARKTTRAGEVEDAWLPPEKWGERWHEDGRPGGAWSLLGQPANQLLGLETLGWIDSGDPTAFAPFTVRQPEHFLMQEPEEVPLEPGGVVGRHSVNGTAVSGYEMDGLPQSVGMAPALPMDGVVLLAHAQHENSYIACDAEDPGYGADAIYWERPNGGRVFNGASVNYTGTLAVDPGIQALTRNVLHHFGVARRS